MAVFKWKTVLNETIFNHFPYILIFSLLTNVSLQEISYQNICVQNSNRLVEVWTIKHWTIFILALLNRRITWEWHLLFYDYILMVFHMKKDWRKQTE